MCKELEIMLFGKFVPPVCTGSVRVDRMGMRDYALKVRHKDIPVKQAVDETLTENWQSVNDFVAMTSVGSTSIRYHLDLMAKRGEILVREIKGRGGKFLRQYRRKS